MKDTVVFKSDLDGFASMSKRSIKGSPSLSSAEIGLYGSQKRINKL